MSNLELSELVSIFQLNIALGVGFSTILEPNRLRIRRLRHKMRLELESLDDVIDDEGARRRRHIIRLMGRLRRIEKRIEKPLQISAAFSLLFAFVNFGLLSWAVTGSYVITTNDAFWFIWAPWLAFFFLSFVTFELGRARLAKISKGLGRRPPTGDYSDDALFGPSDKSDDEP
jgi:hypothetical protein